MPKPNERWLLEQWVSYKTEVLPANAPDIQILECQLAFYAGANALYGLVFDLGEPDRDEAESLQQLEMIRRELHDFLDSMKAGIR